MADYINWYVFFAGVVVGGGLVYSICELIFPIKDEE
jgi:hypothetical protein